MRKALAVVTENRSYLDFENAAIEHIRRNFVVAGRNSESRFSIYGGGTYLVRIVEAEAPGRPQVVGWGLGQRNPVGFNVQDATPMPAGREVKRYSVVEDRLILDGAHRYNKGTNVLWAEFMLDPNNGFYAMVEGQLRITRTRQSVKVYYSQTLAKSLEKREAAARLTDNVVNELKVRHYETGTPYDTLLAAMEAEEDEEPEAQ